MDDVVLAVAREALEEIAEGGGRELAFGAAGAESGDVVAFWASCGAMAGVIPSRLVAL